MSLFVVVILVLKQIYSLPSIYATLGKLLMSQIINYFIEAIAADSTARNMYVADLQSDMKMRGYQYADDTTVYCHAKPKDVETLLRTTNESIEQLGTWASNNNLALNNKTTNSWYCQHKNCQGDMA